MKRAVITGIGVISSLGENKAQVEESLRQGKSGIRKNAEFEEVGLRTHVSGHIEIDPATVIDRKLSRFMTRSTGWGYLAMAQAIEDSGLTPEQVSDELTGLIMGSGGPTTEDVMDAVDTFRKGGVRRVGPYRVTRGMNSSLSSVLSTAFGIRGINYSVTSACATSSHCIGAAVEQIQLGKQQVVFAGGADDYHWSLALQFDAMGALCTAYNDRPTEASRPYDTQRDGFVISGGAGVLVIEELEHALMRGATIYGEVLGYGATSDGQDMVQPSGEGAVRCMQMAWRQAGNRPIQYINTHGTSTKLGDLIELRAVRQVFGDNIPLISSTKSQSGHSLGAAGVHEAIYSLLMLNGGFVSANANLQDVEPEAADMPLVRQVQNLEVDAVLSNSFGFGGTNACLILGKYQPGQ